MRANTRQVASGNESTTSSQHRSLRRGLPIGNPGVHSYAASSAVPRRTQLVTTTSRQVVGAAPSSSASVAAATAAAGSPSSGDHIRVCVRVRPKTVMEQRMDGDATCVYVSEDSVPENQQPLVDRRHGSSMLTQIGCRLGKGVEEPQHQFTFSRVFPCATTQESLYNDVARPILKDVLNGYNGTVFVYGQTGSGKTHTMIGARKLFEVHEGDERGLGGKRQNASATPAKMRGLSGVHEDPHLLVQLDGSEAGILPRVVRDLFEHIRQADEHMEFEVRVYFVEVYMERIRDLLNPYPSGSNLTLREDVVNNRFFIEDCEFPYVTSEQEVMEHVASGLRYRATSSTVMNDVSSRSHCLLNISVRSTDTRKGETRSGKLVLVDLAGSEKVGKTQAEGQQLEEAKLINKSLTTLGLVINCLTEQPGTFVPYRNSKLTRILQDSLGGNSRTALVVCCSPSLLHAHETLSTLRFGARAKHIQNHAVVNREYTVEELQKLLAIARAEISKLRSQQTPETAVVRQDVTRRGPGVGDGSERDSHVDTPVSSVYPETPMSPASSETATGRVAALERSVQWLREEVQLWESEYETLHEEKEKFRRYSELLVWQKNEMMQAAETLAQKEIAHRDDIATIRQAVKAAMLDIRHMPHSVPALGEEAGRAAAAAVRTHNKRSFSEMSRDSASSSSVDDLSQRNSGETLSNHSRWKKEVEEAERAAGLEAPKTHSEADDTIAGESSHRGLKYSKPEDAHVNVNERHTGGRATSSSEYKDPTSPDDSPSPAATELRARVRSLEARVRESDVAWKELMDENRKLVLELQLAEKKLAIRFDRIESLKYGLREERQTSVELQRLLEKDRVAARDALQQARHDSAYWRKRYNELLAEAGAGEGIQGRGGVASPAQTTPHRIPGHAHGREQQREKHGVERNADTFENEMDDGKDELLQLPPFTFTPVRQTSEDANNVSSGTLDEAQEEMRRGGQLVKPIRGGRNVYSDSTTERNA